MADAKLIKGGNINTIANKIETDISALGITMQLVHFEKYHSGDFSVYLFVFEKYYIRINGQVSLTILVTGDENQIMVDLITSGAKSVIFNVSMGAEQKMLRTVLPYFINKGFQQII
jgi:hypothetical protein